MGKIRQIFPYVYIFILLIIIFIVYLYFTFKDMANFVMAINDQLGQFGNIYNKIRYGYLLSTIFAKDNEIYGDFLHKYPGKQTNTWFYASGTPINIGNQEAIFVTGGQGQDDALLVYDSSQNSMKNIIDKTNLSSKKATYGAVSIDLDKDGHSDLIVAREDGVTLYKNIKGTYKFDKISIMDKQKGFYHI